MGDDGGFLAAARREVPEAWLTLEMDLDVAEPKEKVSLYLDKSVAQMFRRMGAGYHARINRILATWVQMKMSEALVTEVDLLSQIEADMAEAGREEVGCHLEEGRRALHQSWAYNQGMLDASEPEARALLASEILGGEGSAGRERPADVSDAA